MHQYLADMTFGIDAQAMAVAQLLSEVEMEGDGIIYTAPWYNNRERGIVFSYQPVTSNDMLHIAVFVHCNNDSICALRWTEPIRVNPPTIDSSGEKAYRSLDKFDAAYSVKYRQIGKMADWVQKEMETYIKNAQPQKPFRSNQ